jgi:ATP-dependent DNA ligase
MEGHPWRDWAEWADAGEDGGRRLPGAKSRWNRGKDMSWEPVRVERACEVAYDHLQGDRFRHATRFVRWRPDKAPKTCRYDQLEATPPYELSRIFVADGARP